MIIVLLWSLILKFLAYINQGIFQIPDFIVKPKGIVRITLDHLLQACVNNKKSLIINNTMLVVLMNSNNILCKYKIIITLNENI